MNGLKCLWTLVKLFQEVIKKLGEKTLGNKFWLSSSKLIISVTIENKLSNSQCWWNKNSRFWYLANSDMLSILQEGFEWLNAYMARWHYVDFHGQLRKWSPKLLRHRFFLSVKFIINSRHKSAVNQMNQNDIAIFVLELSQILEENDFFINFFYVYVTALRNWIFWKNSDGIPTIWMFIVLLVFKLCNKLLHNNMFFLFTTCI